LFGCTWLYRRKGLVSTCISVMLSAMSARTIKDEGLDDEVDDGGVVLTDEVDEGVSVLEDGVSETGGWLELKRGI